MHKIPYALLSLVLIAGCNSSNNGGGGPDLSIAGDLSAPQTPDLSRPPDLYVLGPPNGVTCGLSTCSAGNSCCIPVANPAGATCTVNGGTCPTMGTIPLACDGPEDCNNGMSMPNCCANVTLAGGVDGGMPTITGGNAACTATCAANFSMGGGTYTLTTRLCHAAPDCVGLSFNGIVSFDKCCSNPAVPGLSFCAPSLLNGQMGLTCQ